MLEREQLTSQFKLDQRDTYFVNNIFKFFIVIFIFIGYSQQCLAKSEYDESVVKVYVYGVKTKKGLRYGTGTGFVINDKGYIVTNNHVIADAVRNISKQKPMFILPVGQREILIRGFSKPNVEFVWSSPTLDLAILKVNPKYLNSLGLEPLSFAGSIPDQEEVVKAIGFPGIADTLNVRTVDVAAESTITTGEVGRLIEDGFSARGNGARRLIQHSAFIHSGNSGGPLIDSCGRVVGINTGAPKDIIKDKHGNKTSFSASLAGYYYAVDVRELLDVLRSKNIAFTLSDEKCLGSEEKLNSLIKTGFIIGALGFVVMSLLVFYAMRSPSGRKKVEHVIETYSRRRKPDPVAPKGDDLTSVVANSHANLILDGYGSERQRFRIIINADDLYKGDVVIGRDPNNRKYAINDDSVSRQHCAFYAKENDLFVRDMNSTNGTFVGGRQLASGESAALRNGADIKLGSVTFKVISG